MRATTLLILHLCAVWVRAGINDDGDSSKRCPRIPPEQHLNRRPYVERCQNTSNDNTTNNNNICINNTPQQFQQGPQQYATLIHMAVLQGWPAQPFLQLLQVIEYGINAQDANGDAPLHLAARLPGRAHLAAILIDVGADIHLQNHQGWTPFRLAFQDAAFPLDVLGRLMHAADIDVDDFEYAFTRHNARELIHLLIENGGDLNPPFGPTPIHRALTHNVPPDVLEMLLTPENVNVRDENGRTPVTICRALGRPDLEYVLRMHGGTD